MAFTDDTYQVIRDGCLWSARSVVPTLLDWFAPKSVIDFGCGEGWWLSIFAEHGCAIRGVDGGGGQLAIPVDSFVRADLSHDTVNEGKHDLVLCLEVAEHLPPSRADWLIETLAAHGDLVVFSAAIPGQGGNGHINEQWPDYWVDLWRDQGFEVSGALRWEFWDHPEVECWYKQNMLVCARDHQRYPKLFYGAHNDPIAVVHPRFWQARL